MARFKYRLAPLLKIKENIRTEKQTELAKAYEAQRIVQEQLKQVEEELAKSTEEGRHFIQEGKISVDFLLSLRRHEAHLLSQKKHANEQLELIAQEIERRRIALMEADREVKVLEKLKEKMKIRHLEAENKLAVRQMDEIAGRKRNVSL